LDDKTKIFLAVIDENKNLIYKIVNAYCKNRDLHEDLTQEIISQLWLSFDKYDSNFKMSTWMYRIALNTAISYYRKGINNQKYTLSISSPHEETLISEAPFEEDPNLKLLNQFIQELKEIDKALILLHLDELSHKEIANILGISPTNVGTKLSRVKKILRKKFNSVKQLRNE
jgi:RNA polymerase sigma-70 factor (ECF subfamily)